MTEIKTTIRREGDPAFQVEEKETPGASSTTETETEGGGGEGGGAAPTVPFNEDPKVQDYIQRQVESRTASIEEKLRKEFGDNVAGIRKEIGEQRQKNAEQTKIPKWFGGNQEQWDEYRGWIDQQLQGVEERAINRTFEKAKSQTDEQKKAVDEATEYFRGELAAITADKTLNPSGKPIDPEKLLKVVMDNDLVDSKGRWNYRAGMRLMNSHSTTVHTPKTGDKKLAGATVDGVGGGTGGGAPKNFRTPADFRKKKPW